jgi:nucleoside 2-deoxyribosyltransferase
LLIIWSLPAQPQKQGRGPDLEDGGRASAHRSETMPGCRVGSQSHPNETWRCARPLAGAEPHTQSVRVYFAGPLFSSAERAWNADLVRRLRVAGHEVFLPQEKEQGLDAAAIFRTDVDELDRADAVVAVMDGPDPDSGTAWECGYAYGRKPVILVRTDIRVDDVDPGMPYNAMLTQSATVRLHLGWAEVDDVAAAVLEALASVSAEAGSVRSR